MYHSIDDDRSDVHSVSPTAFEEQMRFLATKCNVISLDQLVDCFSGKGSLPDNPVVITLDDGLANNYTTAYPILKKYDLPATVFVIPNRVAPCEIPRTDESRPDDRRYMVWDQIREMSHDRISVGAHTISHRSLPTLTLEEVRHELLESKARLEQQLGQPVKFFSYPYGAFRDLNKDIMRMVADSGYACAVTSLSGTNGRNTNLYALRRTEIEMNDGMYVFSKAMAGALDNWIVFQRLRWLSQIARGRKVI
jgi:peptidoglycan/xylan/chitin deacetylase (PgdA/CDA1 family)